MALSNMNISKPEQKTLHVLAKGGCIVHHRDKPARIFSIDYCTREGYVLAVRTQLDNQ
jgi:uncharacterized protein YjhX (UPF0386 family)